jgi:hypothetical protein
MRNSKIIDSVWFNRIGIVKVDTEFEIKWYIGEGKGLNQQEDEDTIANRGTPFYPKPLENFFKK